MKNNLKIGITGGIGSGKSIVCRIFGVLGIPVYDADSMAKYIVNNDPVLKEEIISLFGEESFTTKGFNNEWMAARVFQDSEKLNQLNALIHPRVAQSFEDWFIEHKEAPYVIKEAALLYEAGSYKDLDYMIVVTAPEDLRIRRVLKRDSHRNADQIRHIMERQWTETNKVELADHVIVNDDSVLLIPQILDLNARFLISNPNK